MSHSIEIEVPENRGLPRWFDTAAPWMTSIVFHLCIGLLVLFLMWFIVKTAFNIKVPNPIIVPTSFSMDDGTIGGNPNPGEMNSNRTAIQNLLKQIKDDGWSQSELPSNLAPNITVDTGEQAMLSIILGPGGISGGGGGNGITGGILAPYGGINGGGMGTGPTSNFFGCGNGRSYKIVYLIDHSGSLLDNFDYLRDEVKSSVDKLNFAQQFAVVAFSENAEVLGPSGLQHAGDVAKRDLANRVDALKAQGENDGQLLPFQRGFEKAFALKPELIYFLTDGAFDPKLFDVIHRLNPQHKVRINTLAFVQADPQYEGQLKQLAKENGGIYKFVSEKDLEK